jgi:hypothetical protein
MLTPKDIDHRGRSGHAAPGFGGATDGVYMGLLIHSRERSSLAGLAGREVRRRACDGQNLCKLLPKSGEIFTGVMGKVV